MPKIEVSFQAIELLKEITPIIEDVMNQHIERGMGITESDYQQELIEAWKPSDTPDDLGDINCPEFTVHTLGKYMKAIKLLKIL